MPLYRRLSTRELALTVCFTALYTVFSFLPISPIIGLPGSSITATAMIAPVLGLILGPYVGMLSASLGGLIGFFFGHVSEPSLLSGAVAALCAGLLYTGKRGACVFLYFSLMFLFGFYPFVGPVWLYPPLMWFQIIGFLTLISPLQSTALKNLKTAKRSVLTLAVFVTSLTSTLAGQIAGSLTFELISWPIFMANLNVWRASWGIITFLYPIERVIIAVGATLLGVSLYKVLGRSWYQSGV